MTRHQVHGVTEPAPSYHVESAPNSSAVLAVTVLAEMKDVLAVIRTAALLGNSFKASTLVDVMGEDAICLESGENLSQASLESVLDSVQHKLCEYRSSQAPVFALEANITAASFLTAGTISVHIRSVASGPERPIIAR